MCELDEMTFCSMHNRGCKPKTLAGLDTTLAMVYLYDNHSGIQPIAAYERPWLFAEDRQHSERAGHVSNRRYMIK
jgi:hypothetical protein